MAAKVKHSQVMADVATGKTELALDSLLQIVTLTHTHSITLTHSLTHTHTLTLSLSHTHTHTHTHSTHTYTLSHTHSRTGYGGRGNREDRAGAGLAPPDRRACPPPRPRRHPVS